MATGSINISSNISRSEMMRKSYPPYKCVSITATSSENKAYIRWEDPEITEYNAIDGVVVKWGYTKLIRKTGSCPINDNDGTVLVESSIKNQYKETPFIDNGVITGETYYYAVFSYSVDGSCNIENVSCEIEIQKYQHKTLIIDLNNSNPRTWGTYADDAVGMSYGIDSEEWYDFFKYRPCLFKDGKVVGYLNPNNYGKFENGEDADITSGESGDVMIEFPLRKIKINKSKDNKLTISMTNDPNDTSYERLAFTGDYFYLGAYLVSTKVRKSDNRSVYRSLSKSTIVKTQDPYSQYIVNLDSRYGVLGYYQWLYIQIMYMLQFKGNTNMQLTCGKVSSIPVTPETTGSQDTFGMMSKYHNDKNGEPVHAKLFGLEYIYGAYNQFVDNVRWYDGGYQLRTTRDYSYTSYARDVHSTNGVYYTDCVGDTTCGFLPVFPTNAKNGSSSTYFAAKCRLESSNYPTLYFGGDDGDTSSLFTLTSNFYSNRGVPFSTRLMYV